MRDTKSTHLTFGSATSSLLVFWSSYKSSSEARIQAWYTQQYMLILFALLFEYKILRYFFCRKMLCAQYLDYPCRYSLIILNRHPIETIFQGGMGIADTTDTFYHFALWYLASVFVIHLGTFAFRFGSFVSSHKNLWYLVCTDNHVVLRSLLFVFIACIILYHSLLSQ